MQTKNMTLCAFFTILFVLASKIVIPLGIIPLTLQPLVVILAGVLLSPKQIGISYALYFLMGLLGLPVFASGGGISYVLQPSFGFLLAFPFAACFISIIKQTFKFSTIYQLLPICMFALFIIYTIGCIYMYGIMNYSMGIHKNMGGIIAIGALPFLLSDAISATLGCICGLRLAKVPAIQRSLAQLS